VTPKSETGLMWHIIGCYLQRRLWSDLRLADYTPLGLINVAPLIAGKALDVHA
jgi:hypothetical protein